MSSSVNSTDLLHGFDSNITHTRHELTNNKEARQKGVSYNTIRFLNFLGFANQDKMTFALGHNLTLKQNTNNNALYRTASVAEAKIIIEILHCMLKKLHQTLIISN